MPNTTPANTPLPDVPLSADIETTAWMQEVGANLNQILLDKGPPSLVTGLTATANSATIVLRWNAAQNASIYRIYRNTTGDFDSASVVQTVGASKTGVASLSAQDSQDQTQAQRFYWVQAVNERGMTGPQSQMVVVTNFTAASGSTALGDNAQASGTNSTALGKNAQASGTNSTALGISAVATNTDSIAIGYTASTVGADAIALGTNAAAAATDAVSIGNSSRAGFEGVSVGTSATTLNNGGGVAVGWNADASGATQSIAIGFSALASGSDSGIAFGSDANVQNFDFSVAVGAYATADSDHQFMKGGGDTNNLGYFDAEVTAFGPNGERLTTGCIRELTTVAAAAFTDTAIQIPAGSVVYGVSIRVTTTVPTAANLAVGVNGNSSLFSAGTSTTAGSTNPGINTPMSTFPTAMSVRITPNVNPANNSGRVRVAIFYYSITPATS